MKIDFNNIYDHIISMDKFRMNWRFTDPKYDVLPDIHLNQIKPLDDKAAKFLWDYILFNNLHNDTPFTKGFFRTIDKVLITEDNNNDIKKWLYQRALPFDKDVFLSYQPDTAIIAPWKIVIKYFDSFQYQYSDDLTIIDQSLNWALLFFHEGRVYFGTNEDYKLSEATINSNLI